MSGYSVDHYWLYVNGHIVQDAKTLDKPWQFALEEPPGQYTIDVLTEGNSSNCTSFPFGISKQYTATVVNGETEIVTIDMDEAKQVGISCPVTAFRCPHSVSDVHDQLQTMTDFRSDPVVIATIGLKASLLSKSEGTVVIDLPDEDGGPREFSTVQIAHIANAILLKYRGLHITDPSQLNTCYDSDPDYRPLYDQWKKVLEDYKDRLNVYETLGSP
jgi:hypothetical protein